MTTLAPKQAVSIVIKAMEAKQPDSKIAELLITAGANVSDASTIICSVRDGFKSGVQSKVMGTRAHPNGDAFYLEAFSRGRFALRFTSPGWVLLRMISPYLIGAVIVGYFVWRFLF